MILDRYLVNTVVYLFIYFIEFNLKFTVERLSVKHAKVIQVIHFLKPNIVIIILYHVIYHIREAII